MGVFNKRLSNKPEGCEDHHERCEEWATWGECDKNPGYMKDTCPLSCKACTKSAAADKLARLGRKGVA